MLRVPTLFLGLLAFTSGTPDVTLRGDVVDAETGKPLPCRVTIRGADAKFHFAKSASPEGSAIEYRKVSGTNPASIEHHVTLSAHPFTVDLPPGTYTISVQRGKEYLPETRRVEVGDAGAAVAFKL